MGSLTVLEAICECSNNDNALNLNHINTLLKWGLFSLSVSWYVCARARVRACVRPKSGTFNNTRTQVPTLSK